MCPFMYSLVIDAVLYILMIVLVYVEAHQEKDFVASGKSAVHRIF